ncbi:MAG: LysM peptidoglycan-binding domain-containing protein [Verrucomicrobiae bacterium]|nr:LysM peptidoglycan-binding domain-containing protein [Verrucomicrobiae bacterium]
MRRAASALLALLLPLLASCDRLDLGGDKARQADRALERARKLLEMRDFSGAAGAYEDVLRAESSRADAHFQAALIYDRNLNDCLNAAWHYKRYLDSPNADSKKTDLVKSCLDNTLLRLAAGVPNAGSQNSPELVKLRTENTALYRQVEDLKHDIVRLRSRLEPAKSATQTAAVPAARPPAAAASKAASPAAKAHAPASARPRSYTVQRGDGLQTIAEKVYGNRSRWRDILSANPSLKDPSHLRPGQALIIPP